MPVLASSPVGNSTRPSEQEVTTPHTYKVRPRPMIEMQDPRSARSVDPRWAPGDSAVLAPQVQISASPPSGIPSPPTGKKRLMVAAKGCKRGMPPLVDWLTFLRVGPPAPVSLGCCSRSTSHKRQLAARPGSYREQGGRQCSCFVSYRYYRMVRHGNPEPTPALQLVFRFPRLVPDVLWDLCQGLFFHSKQGPAAGREDEG
ncbi:hypothetical protein B0I37DRAFT_377084, partial [Chaetomium sp. MPI-CAGE-AT-0009]